VLNRKVLEKTGLVLLAVVVLFWFGREYISDASSCDSTKPANAVQRVALADLKSRKASECEGPHKGCQYLITERPDGTVEITFWNIGERSGSECISQDCCYETFRYDREGKLQAAPPAA
jgi:hypothetical protein